MRAEGARDTTTSVGRIVRLQPRGYGLIQPADGRGTIFFHASAVVGIAFAELRVGDPVRFAEEATLPGRHAVEVRRAVAW